jgi:hypothetical protein
MGSNLSNLSFGWVRRGPKVPHAIDAAPATPPITESTTAEPPTTESSTTESPPPLNSSILNPTPAFTWDHFQRIKTKYYAISAELESHKVWYETNKDMAKEAQYLAVVESSMMKIGLLESEKHQLWEELKRMLKSTGEGPKDEWLLRKRVAE